MPKTPCADGSQSRCHHHQPYLYDNHHHNHHCHLHNISPKVPARQDKHMQAKDIYSSKKFVISQKDISSYNKVLALL